MDFVHRTLFIKKKTEGSINAGSFSALGHYQSVFSFVDAAKR